MKKIIKIIVLSLCIVTGCTGKETESLTNVSATEKSQIWHQERKKTFGTYDYKELKSEKEAKHLLTDKFKLAIPAFYKETKDVLMKSFVTERQMEITERYDVIVNDVTATFLTTYYFEEAGKPSLEATIELKYLFDSGKQRVQLDKQTLLVRSTSQEDKVILSENIHMLSKKMAPVMKITNIEKGLEEYQEQYENNKGNLSQQTIVIWENQEEAAKKKSVLKSIQVYFDGNSVATEFYCNISDKTE